jgi:hypothetical protein
MRVKITKEGGTDVTIRARLVGPGLVIDGSLQDSVTHAPVQVVSRTRSVIEWTVPATVHDYNLAVSAKPPPNSAGGSSATFNVRVLQGGRTVPGYGASVNPMDLPGQPVAQAPGAFASSDTIKLR